MNSSIASKLPALFFLFLITVDGFKTTFFSANVVSGSRYVLAVLLLLSIANIIWRDGFGLRRGIGIVLYLLVVIFALFAMTIHSGSLLLPDLFVINTVLTLLGIFLFAGRDQQVFPTWAAVAFLVYGALFLVVSALGSGAEFFPSRFNFEYYSDREGGTVEYSQGLTRNLGLMLMCAVFLYCNFSRFFWKRALMLCIACLASWLAFMAGSRGELLAALMVSLLIMIFNGKYFIVFGLVACAGLTAILTSDLALGRFSAVLDGDYGMRDVLFSQAINLLSSDYKVFFFGCGYGCFQRVYGYPDSLYPHNFLLEFLISFGVLLTLVFVFFTIYGVYRYWKSVKNFDLLLIFFVFYFLVSMKSGDLFGGWLFMVSCIYFSTICVQYSSRKSINKSHIGPA